MTLLREKSGGVTRARKEKGRRCSASGMRELEDEVLREFLDTFDSPDEKDGKVRKGCPCYAWLDPPPRSTVALA